MQGIGGLLILWGIGAFLLPYAGIQFLLISWIDHWGPGVANGIRIAMIVVGGVLWLLGRQSAARAASPPS